MWVEVALQSYCQGKPWQSLLTHFMHHNFTFRWHYCARQPLGIISICKTSLKSQVQEHSHINITLIFKAEDVEDLDDAGNSFGKGAQHMELLGLETNKQTNKLYIRNILNRGQGNFRFKDPYSQHQFLHHTQIYKPLSEMSIVKMVVTSSFLVHIFDTNCCTILFVENIWCKLSMMLK